MPRAGVRKATAEKSSQDDTNVIVTNRRGVRIRICGDDILSNNSFSDEERQQQQQQQRAFKNNNNVITDEAAHIVLDNGHEQGVQTSLDFNSFVEKKEVNISASPTKSRKFSTKKASKSKRKYTLEELEVEGFEPSTSESGELTYFVNNSNQRKHNGQGRLQSVGAR